LPSNKEFFKFSFEVSSVGKNKWPPDKIKHLISPLKTQKKKIVNTLTLSQKPFVTAAFQQDTTQTPKYYHAANNKNQQYLRVI